MVSGFKTWAVYSALALSVVIFLSAIFLVVSILYGMSWSGVTAPPRLGNRPEVISRLTDGQSDALPFSFLVVGDTRSSTIFENFYEGAPLDVTPDFGVILGDFVAYPELNRHRFFMGELAAWGMRFPVFLIVGNHDIVTRHTRRLNRLYDPVSQEDFEKLYGPAEFSFIYRGCLFVGLNNPYRIDYLDYARGVLSRRPPDTLMTFVFMHIPPPSLSPLVKVRGLEGEKEFMSLMETYNVDYVFMGDFHSYFRTDDGHTKYVISGGGGSPIHDGGARSFHHALLMMVDPSKKKVDEVIYSFKPAFDPGDDIEIIMICGLYPIFEGHPLAWAALFCLAAVATAGLIVLFIARIDGKRHTGHRAGA